MTQQFWKLLNSYLDDGNMWIDVNIDLGTCVTKTGSPLTRPASLGETSEVPYHFKLEKTSSRLKVELDGWDLKFR